MGLALECSYNLSFSHSTYIICKRKRKGKETNKKTVKLTQDSLCQIKQVAIDNINIIDIVINAVSNDQVKIIIGT